MKEINSFKELNLLPELQNALTKQGYEVPTPIQLKSIPDLMIGKDLIGIAQTGTGKTAAFILPILHRMTEAYPRKIKTLVLAPTRELAAQIGESFTEYGQFLKFKHVVIFGGVKQGAQVLALSRGVDISGKGISDIVEITKTSFNKGFFWKLYQCLDNLIFLNYQMY